VILATCDQIDPREFRVPANFVVEKFLPVSKVLEVADLVLYHGGAGTFQQAARAGVPGVVVATHWDQEWAGRLTQQRRLGSVLTLHEVRRTPGLIAAAVEGVLTDLPAHRQRAALLRDALAKHDGPSAAADRIEAFLASLPAPG
jgi:UDP:flavonoid glycosyltransferase YjiC (YdhE family)